MFGNEPEILDSKFEDDRTLSLWTNQKIRKTGFAPIKRVYGRKSKFGSDIHTPGHIEYLHTKFHHRTTSNKKVRKTGCAPISRQKWSRALVLKIDFWNIWWFHMLGNEPEILDFKFEDDTTLSLWTNQKFRKTGFVPPKNKRVRGRKSKFGSDIHTPGHLEKVKHWLSKILRLSLKKLNTLLFNSCIAYLNRISFNYNFIIYWKVPV